MIGINHIVMLDNKLTVVIRNRNEAEYIDLALKSVYIHFPKSEVIIVDNNSTDNSLDVVDSYFDKLNLIKLNINDYTPGKSLNLAISHAQREYTLILSAHCELIKIDNKIIIEELENHMALFGKQIPYRNIDKIIPTNIWTHFSSKKEINMFSDIEKRNFLHNAFCFYKTNSLIEIPFDEELKGKEDRYWAKKIVDLNKTYVYNPIIKCNHYFTDRGATWKDV